MLPEQLGELLLFEGLPDDFLSWCAPRIMEVEVRGGERAGWGSDDFQFFVVVLGRFELLRDLQPVIALPTGQFWLPPEPRSTCRSFVAVAQCQSWYGQVRRDDYRRMRETMPIWGERIDETIEARTVSLGLSDELP